MLYLTTADLGPAISYTTSEVPRLHHQVTPITVFLLSLPIWNYNSYLIRKQHAGSITYGQSWSFHFHQSLTPHSGQLSVPLRYRCNKITFTMSFISWEKLLRFSNTEDFSVNWEIPYAIVLDAINKIEQEVNRAYIYCLLQDMQRESWHWGCFEKYHA